MTDDFQKIVDEYNAIMWATVGEEIKEKLTAQYLAAITGPVSQEAIDAARALAETAARSLVKDLTTTQLKSMGETIADALAAGKRPKDIANKLTEVTMLDSNRLKTLDKIEAYLKEQGLSPEAFDKAMEKAKAKLIKQRRETIARTEGNKAVSAAREAEARARGAKYKGWTTGQDERLCLICTGNEAAGIIAIDDEFPSGAKTPPAHPNCRCAVYYVTSDAAKAAAEERQAQRAEETAAMQAQNAN